MKSASLMLALDATSEPTFTAAPLPNKTPFGLTKNTLPLDDRLPMMLDASPPTTRFSATELLFGCKKVTTPLGPIEKLCQLIATFWVVWVMVVVLAPLLMVAPPAVTTPPVGCCACAAGAKASASALTRAVRAKRATALAEPDDAPLPAPFACSETATKVPACAFHIDR